MQLPPGKFKSRGREYLFDVCPFCFAEKKFYWNPGKNKGHCHSGFCNRKIVGMHMFRKVLGGILGEDDRVEATTNWRTFFQDRQERTERLGGMVDVRTRFDSRVYLERRQVELEGLDTHLRYSEDEDAMTIEIDPWSPEYPISHLYRKINQPGSKWLHLREPDRQRYGYGMRHHRGQTAMLVEGVFDVLTPNLLGLAVATLGTTLRQDALAWLLAQNVQRVIIWYDPDLAGVKASIKAAEALNGWGFDVVAVLPTRQHLEEVTGKPLEWEPWERVEASLYFDCNQEPGDLEPEHPIMLDVLGTRL